MILHLKAGDFIASSKDATVAWRVDYRCDAEGAVAGTGHEWPSHTNPFGNYMHVTEFVRDGDGWRQTDGWSFRFVWWYVLPFSGWVRV